MNREIAAFGHLRTAILGSVSLACLAAATPALAQDKPDPQAAQTAKEQEIIVTGSRIKLAPGMSTPQPVTSLTSDELSNMAPGSITESLAQLPQFYNDATIANPGGFFATPGSGSLNLRGLGANRTLTLLDGRRIVPNSRLGVVDINVLPEELFARVETQTGGASAAYGTDAVAGVVNFVLDKKFDGIKGHAQGGITERGDNQTYELSLTYGAQLNDKLHVLLSAGWFNQDGIFSFANRDWYKSYGLITNPSYTTSCGCVKNVVAPNVVSTLSTLGGMINQAGSALNHMSFNPDGSVSPFVAGQYSTFTGTSTQSITNGGTGTYADLDDPTLTPDANRGSVFARADYDFSDKVSIFAQALGGKVWSFSRNTPGNFTTPLAYQFTIYSGNAFLPASVQSVMNTEHLASFRMDRNGSILDVGRDSATEQDNKTLSLTGGLHAVIGGDGFMSNWTVDGYYQWGETKAVGRQEGGIRQDRVYAAIDAVKDANGNIVCRAALLDPTNWGNCVPINLFGQGRASQAAIDYISGIDPGQHVSTKLYFATAGGLSDWTYNYVSSADKVNRSTMTENVAELQLAGDVWQGWGAGKFSGAFGWSWRKETVLQIIEDPTNPSNDPSARPVVGAPGTPGASIVRGVPVGAYGKSFGVQFSNVPNIQGDYDVWEYFAELRMPIVKDVTALKDVNVDLAGRYASYSGSGGIWAWKAGLDWQVYSDLRFRATRSRDVRAGNMSERFDFTGGLGSISDPVVLDANGNKTTYGITTRTGGNPNIQPEKSDTTTVGVVFQPSFARGLQMSVDWYNIEIHDQIGQLTPQYIVDQCYAGATALCALITRDASIGNRVTIVNAVNQNINLANYNGIDFELDYRTPVNVMGQGTITFRGFATYLHEASQTVSGVKSDQAGSVGASLPHWKGTGSITYSQGGFSWFLQSRLIGGGVVAYNYVDNVDLPASNNHVNPVVYFDTTLNYAFGMHRQYKVFVTVTNLFDKDPPIIPSYLAAFETPGQYNASLYDVLGRRYTAGVKFQF
jgi:outer membrane receptor protein involved in Fe transport